MTVGLPDDGDTNVRVAARVRPLLPREKVANSCSCVTVHKSKGQVVVGTRRSFAFDVVFDTDSTQSEVYDSCVTSLLTGCLQGYNATILAYGQTGSGKTHTMGTGQSAEFLESTEEEGITPKVIRNSFEYFERYCHEVNFKASCSYIELYNEEIRDLLQPNAPKHLINIRENADGVIQIAGIHAEECSAAEDMLRCLNDGSVQRTTGATLMNEQSSRSHSIFTIIIEQSRRSQNEIGGGDSDVETPGHNRTSVSGSCEGDGSLLSYRTAKFHLVDLAGSERAKRTGAVGSRFKESVSINTGLLALGNVISALGDPAKRGCHVPYRESKLTRLLQDSLGGNSRTLMLACASCADSDFEETLNTLKYAHRARNIKNKPVVNHDPRVAQLAAMQDEIQALRNELQRVSEGYPGAGSLYAARRNSTDNVEADGALIGELSEKLEAAERRNEELVERLVTVEADSEALRRSFIDCYSIVCQQLPALAQLSGGATNGTLIGAGPMSTEASTPQPGTARARQVSSALREALQAAWKALGEAVPAPVGCDPDEAAADSNVSSAAAPSAEAGETARLQSLSEMRKDSTLLIRKYLDEIKRLENELVMSRRKIKQQQEELLEANEDLRKDEEIFEEKMREMKAVLDRNAELERTVESYSHGLTAPSFGEVHSQSTEATQADRALLASRLEDRDEVRTDEPDFDTPCLGDNAAGDVRTQEDHVEEDSRGLKHTAEELQEAVRVELEESRGTQEQLEQEVETIKSNLTEKEELILRSEREWGATKMQYQQRMAELQVELDQLQQQLASVQGQLAESAHLKEQTKQMEEEKQRLEQCISEQLNCIHKSQEEFSRLLELRDQDNKTIHDLETEAQQMKGKLQELNSKLQGERKRTARLEDLKSQQIDELQRRLQNEGQKVKHLEAENLRQRESLKREQQKHRSATPLSRKGSAVGVSTRDDKRGSVGSSVGTSTSGGGTSSTARANRLDQQINAHILRQEASQSLEEDIRKRDNLLRKREQYLNYRKKITAKDSMEQQEAAERLRVLEAQLARIDQEIVEAAASSTSSTEAVPELRLKQDDLNREREQLMQLGRDKQAEGLAVLRDVDERLDGLQDEIDFREARIDKSRQLLRPSSSAQGAASHTSGGYPSQPAATGQLSPEALSAELAGVPAEDAKELLSRYCEHIVRMKQREKEHSKRLTAVETQLEERTRQVAELQRVLRRHDANATKAIAKVEKDYEGRIRHLLRQLNAARQQQQDQQPPELRARGPSSEDLHSANPCSAAAGGSEVGVSKASADESEEIKMLRRDNHAFKMMNRELKRRMKVCLGQEAAFASGQGSARGSGAGAGAVAGSSSNGRPEQSEEVAAQLRQLERDVEHLLDENSRVKEENARIKQYYCRFHEFQPSTTGRPKPGAPGPIPPDAAVTVVAAAATTTIA